MIPVQYRDPRTEGDSGAPLRGGCAGHRDTGEDRFRRYQVLYRWRCVPTSCIVYVHRVVREVRKEARPAA